MSNQKTASLQSIDERTAQESSSLALTRRLVLECGWNSTSYQILNPLLLSPITNRNGWLFEQFIYRPGAPNGTVELMIDTAMRPLGEEDYDYATLGLSPLSSRAQVAPFRNPFRLRSLLRFSLLFTGISYKLTQPKFPSQ